MGVEASVLATSSRAGLARIEPFLRPGPGGDRGPHNERESPSSDPPDCETTSVFLIDWISELSPSLWALVIRGSKSVKALSRCPRIVRAARATGASRECVARKYQRPQ